MDISVFDKNAALDRLGGDLDLLIELAGMFLEDCPRMLDGIESALDSGDSDSVQRLAHSLKGAVGNFSAKAAFDVAQGLEDIGREGDLSRAQATFSDLKQELERLMPALSGLK
jgi:HPt (histidine-containing phosphotransfer) domain-containing protein